MRNRFHCFFGAILAVLLTGCFTDKRPIEFTDSYQPTKENSLPAKVKEPGLTKAELAQIEFEVFSYLLVRDWDDDKELSAIFITGEEAQTTALIKKFPRHVPPLKQWWHLEPPAGGSPKDADTGRAALVLSADVDDPEDGRVSALGKWFAGDAVAGFHTFELKREGQLWKIQSVK